MAKVYLLKGKDAYETTARLLKRMRFRLKGKKVLIKPNLTIAVPASQGITTDPGVVHAVLERLEGCEVTIAEGGLDDMAMTFRKLGYEALAKEFNTRLVDLNRDKVVMKPIPRPVHAAEIPFAKTVFECDYLVNCAKLKIHSLAKVTLCLKNLFGAVPTRKNKLIYHPYIKKAICDFMQVIRSDLNLIDGIVGNQTEECQPDPVRSNIMIGSYNAIAADLVGAACMGVDPAEVEYLQLAQKLFGKQEVEIEGERLEDVAKNYKCEQKLSTSVRYAVERFMSECYRRTK